MTNDCPWDYVLGRAVRSWSPPPWTGTSLATQPSTSERRRYAGVKSSSDVETSERPCMYRLPGREPSCITCQLQGILCICLLSSHFGDVFQCLFKKLKETFPLNGCHTLGNFSGIYKRTKFPTLPQCWKSYPNCTGQNRLVLGLFICAGDKS